jgi:hypothetical protein
LSALDPVLSSTGFFHAADPLIDGRSLDAVTRGSNRKKIQNNFSRAMPQFSGLSLWRI